jgi:hypothetical protein
MRRSDLGVVIVIFESRRHAMGHLARISHVPIENRRPGSEMWTICGPDVRHPLSPETDVQCRLHGPDP